MEFTRLGYTFRFYYDILDADESEQGVDVYNANSGECLAEVPGADIKELEQMDEDELQEWVDEMTDID